VLSPQFPNSFTAIVDAALRIKAESFVIDGEAVIAREQRDVGLPRVAEGCSRKTDAASRCTRVNLFRQH
jgi:ATP-dependent DNA ligase